MFQSIHRRVVRNQKPETRNQKSEREKGKEEWRIVSWFLYPLWLLASRSWLLLLAACSIPLPLQLPPVEESSVSSAASSAASSKEVAEGDIGGEVPLPTETPTLALTQRLLTGGLLEVGPTNAPVTLLVFTNHACRYCREFQETYLPRLLAEHVATGRLRILTVLFPLKKYPESTDAARILHCSALQGKGHEMQERLFTGGGGKVALQASLQELAIDAVRFQGCLRESATIAAFASQKNLADALGVTLVPTFFVNGVRTVGLPTYADVRGSIESMFIQ